MHRAIGAFESGSGALTPEVLSTGYGWAPEVQRKVVALVLRDRDVYRRLGGSVFNPRYISHAPLRVIAGEVFGACASGDGTPPSPELAEQLVSERLTALRPSVGDAVRKEWVLVLSADLSDARLILSKIAEWAQTQACVEATLKAADLVERGITRNGGGAQLLQLFQDALAVGKTAEASLRLIGDEEGVLEELTRELYRTSTGFPALDAALEGGAEPGLHVVAGDPKLGKTSFLTQISIGAARQGLTVFHVSGEVALRPMVGRFVPGMTGLSRAEVRHDPHRAVKMIRGYKQTGGEIIAEYMPGFTPMWVASRVRQLEANGERIGAITGDFIDLMRMDGRAFTEKRHVQEQVCQDIRALALDMGIPFWTAKGVNRKAVGKIVVTKADLAECFAVAYVADNIFALCSTEEERQHKVVIHGQEVKRPRVRVFYAAGRETLDEFMIAGYERDNDRQRWREIPGYLRAIAEQATAENTGNKGGETEDT